MHVEPHGGFSRRVWSRVEGVERSKDSEILAIFGWVRFFGQPRMALVATMFALFGGVFLGGVQARSAQESRYFQSLNPYTVQARNR